jgi:hypothetical protein
MLKVVAILIGVVVIFGCFVDPWIHGEKSFIYRFATSSFFEKRQ